MKLNFFPSAAKSIKEGCSVSLEYNLRLEESGGIIDSSIGVFTIGNNEIIPGLEKRIIGMSENETQDIIIEPKDGYGEVIEVNLKEVPLSQIPSNVKVGTQLKTTKGESIRVVEIKKESAVLDFNHPLAGKTLYFNIKILSIYPPKPQSN